MQIPFYLQQKLESLAISTPAQIKELGYLEVFARLKAIYPSLAMQGLFDLYIICQQQKYPDQTIQAKLISQFKQLPKRYPPLEDNQLKIYLNEAEKEAQIALAAAEIPIGAVVVYQDQIIGRGFNQTRTQQDILAHAEIQALREAQQVRQSFRLDDCDLYVTIEPCLMCSGAIINSRIRRLIYGAKEPKTGAIQSQYQVFANTNTNHHCQIIGPIDDAYYSQLIRQFFINK